MEIKYVELMFTILETMRKDTYSSNILDAKFYYVSPRNTTTTNQRVVPITYISHVRELFTVEYIIPQF